MKTVYPAIIHEDDGAYWVEFPDLEGCFSDGETVANAIFNAEEALGAYLCSLAERGISIPDPSSVEAINPDDGLPTLIAADPMKYIRSTKAIKKTLTIPEWLNKEAEKRHVNFSAILQQALLAYIE